MFILNTLRRQEVKFLSTATLNWMRNAHLLRRAFARGYAILISYLMREPCDAGTRGRWARTWRPPSRLCSARQGVTSKHLHSSSVICKCWKWQYVLCYITWICYTQYQIFFSRQFSLYHWSQAPSKPVAIQFFIYQYWLKIYLYWRTFFCFCVRLSINIKRFDRLCKSAKYCIENAGKVWLTRVLSSGTRTISTIWARRRGTSSG